MEVSPTGELTARTGRTDFEPFHPSRRTNERFVGTSWFWRLGRRVGKKRSGNLERGWLYDGQLRIVAELDRTGAVASRFIYGTLSHSPDVMVRGGVTYRYVHDVLGSVRLLIDVATGQVAQRIDYDSWGVITSDSSPGFQPFAFAAGLFDTDTRLTRFGARDYDAATGRWMSKDPIGFGGGANHFSYCQGAPTGFVDLNGLRVSPIANVAVRNAINNGRLTTDGQNLYNQLDSSPYDYTFEAGENLGPAEDAFGVTKARYDKNGNYTGATIVIDIEKIAFSSARTFGDVTVHEISHATKYDSTCGKRQGGPAAERAAYRDSYDYREEMFKKTGRKEYDPIDYLKAIDPINCPFPNACGAR
jgi:RHS repeat-associated protein